VTAIHLVHVVHASPKAHSNLGNYSWAIQGTNAFTPNPYAQAQESNKPVLGD